MRKKIFLSYEELIWRLVEGFSSLEITPQDLDNSLFFMNVFRKGFFEFKPSVRMSELFPPAIHVGPKTFKPQNLAKVAQAVTLVKKAVFEAEDNNRVWWPTAEQPYSYKAFNGFLSDHGFQMVTPPSSWPECTPTRLAILIEKSGLNLTPIAKPANMPYPYGTYILPKQVEYHLDHAA